MHEQTRLADDGGQGGDASGADRSERRSHGDHDASRRRLLRVAGGAIATVGLSVGSSSAAGATAGATADGTSTAADLDRDCQDATLEPSMTHYDHSVHDVCADDHYETRALQYRVRSTLESQYPTVGSLVDDGFVPYFDFFAEEATWSHWLHPEYVGDDGVLDPARPESVLVDHEYWRPMGVMFIATPDGDRLDPPPSVYAESGGECTPWHAHVGVPGRYAWAKFRAADGGAVEWPCRTPWMMHVWNYADEHVYAHGAPDDRGGAPAEPAGFDTDADTSEEPLAPEHLPDALRERSRDRWGDVATRWGDAWADAWDEATDGDATDGSGGSDGEADDEDDGDGWDLPWNVPRSFDLGQSK
ncbi:hypothetical protein [Halorubellus sp. JP-L1]|uniref:hypothetical protein n=1 Tax=Halorubellus sp. JP-L1 TaxID=2715753 RepID=UPI00196561CF|nr:hypothetical protein [Halorubellus sp. JP-L1]